MYSCINVLIVPPEAVVIQSVTHDEVVGDAHGGILDVEVHLQLFGLDEQGGDVYLLRAAGTECFKQALHGEACVYNVFHDDDGTPAQVFVDADDFLDVACRLHALVGGQLDERFLAVVGVAFHQVGS